MTPNQPKPIVGPRRAGKTTLVRKMGEAGRTYITLDDQTVLEAAQSDPAGFIRSLDRAIIDGAYFGGHVRPANYVCYLRPQLSVAAIRGPARAN